MKVTFESRPDCRIELLKMSIKTKTMILKKIKRPGWGGGPGRFKGGYHYPRAITMPWSNKLQFHLRR